MSHGSYEVWFLNNRTRSVIKNIFLSVLWKGISVLLSLLIVPLTVSYLSVVEYGVWITVFTVMNWVNLLDVGIGLGMRNKLAEAVSLNDSELIKKYISTGFISMCIIGLFLFLLFMTSIQFINFQDIFNTNSIVETVLFQAVMYTGIFVIISFVLSIINNIFYAYQKASYTGLIQIIHNGLMLIIIWYLTQRGIRDFIFFIFAYGIALLTSRIVMIVYFLFKHRDCYPRTEYFDYTALKDITKMGVDFFIIQIACIVVFSSSSILITQYLGIDYVREYDIAFKVFSIVTMLHTLISTPLWNGYTDAYIRGDLTWIRNMIKKMILLMIPVTLFVGLIYIFFDWIVFVWIRQDIKIDSLISLGMACFAIISCWNNIFAMFVNGIGKTKVQMYSSVLSILVLIPLAIIFMQKFGSAGMIFATVVVLLFNGIPIAIQSYYILK